MLLAEVYGTGVDVSRYWVSEKFDGVRAQWDGHTLRFRSGGIVPAPSWFTANSPKLPLDRDLWIARGHFDALSATVRRIEPVDTEWQQVHY
jgi:DNA ligase